MIRLFLSYLPFKKGIMILEVSRYADRGRRGEYEECTADDSFPTKTGSDIEIECLLLSLLLLVTQSKCLLTIFPEVVSCKLGIKFLFDVLGIDGTGADKNEVPFCLVLF